MARTPQRDERWSLRQVHLAASVGPAVARSAVRAGHLDADDLDWFDAVVLRAVVMVSSFQPFDEPRPANSTRVVPAREIEAVQSLRSHGDSLAASATLLVTEGGAQLLSLLSEAAAAGLTCVERGEAYLLLPVGRWASELATPTLAEVA